MVKNMEPLTRIKILVGIPCSGKSTYAKTLPKNMDKYTAIISRDTIREFGWLFKQPYKFSKQNEDLVTIEFYRQFNLWLEPEKGCFEVCLDNTHCQQKYIDRIICDYGKIYEIQIKFFDISFFKANYRNIVRYFKTGKWIPINVMNSMYKNYNKINKKKYEKYS